MDDFPKKFPRTSAVIAAGITEGLHTVDQIYISRAGKPVADTAVGSPGMGWR